MRLSAESSPWTYKARAPSAFAASAPFSNSTVAYQGPAFSPSAASVPALTDSVSNFTLRNFPNGPSAFRNAGSCNGQRRHSTRTGGGGSRSATAAAAAWRFPLTCSASWAAPLKPIPQQAQCAAFGTRGRLADSSLPPSVVSSLCGPSSMSRLRFPSFRGCLAGSLPPAAPAPPRFPLRTLAARSARASASLVSHTSRPPPPTTSRNSPALASESLRTAPSSVPCITAGHSAE
eukprot:scaffold204808_cov29-Tisochrysis_lutea.AAC.2